MTEPPPPGPTDDVENDRAAAEGREAPAQLALPTVNATWKRVHACNFEKVVRAQLGSNVCDEAKVHVSSVTAPAPRRINLRASSDLRCWSGVKEEHRQSLAAVDCCTPMYST